MGQEIICTVEHKGRTSEGRALLETSELIFRGDPRLKIPFKEMTRVVASDGALRIRFAQGEATFYLGAAAAKWASKILNPRSRLDKLGVKAGTRLRWIGAPDHDFKSEVAQRGALLVRTKPEVTFLHASGLRDLDGLKLAGAPVWVVYPKGISQLREMDVLKAGRDAGLVDIKVASFSATHTALKFVYPRG